MNGSRQLNKMKLSKEELAHPIWKKLEEHISERVKVNRKINDNLMPENETCGIRGEIKAYKSILRLNPEYKD